MKEEDLKYAHEHLTKDEMKILLNIDNHVERLLASAEFMYCDEYDLITTDDKELGILDKIRLQVMDEFLQTLRIEHEVLTNELITYMVEEGID